MLLCIFFFNDTATTEIYTLSLHDALPICRAGDRCVRVRPVGIGGPGDWTTTVGHRPADRSRTTDRPATGNFTSPADRKSTRLKSSSANISYSVFFLKQNTSTIGFSPYNRH